VPKTSLKVCEPAANSGTFVLPVVVIPACLSRAMMSESVSGTRSAMSGEPQVVRIPAVSCVSLCVIGTPWRAPRRSPRAVAASAASAWAKAASSSRVTTALMMGLTSSMRSRCASRASRAEMSLAAIRAASSRVEHHSSSSSSMSLPDLAQHRGQSGADARRQCGLDIVGGEERRVVSRRRFVTAELGGGVAAEEPVDIGHVDVVAEGPEVLTSGHRALDVDVLVTELGGRAVDEGLGLVGIVVAAGEAVHVLDEGLGCSGGQRLGEDDPPAPVEDDFAEVLAEAADAEFVLGGVGDDVLLEPTVEGPDGDHGHIPAGDLPGDHGLQAGDHIGAEDDRVDGVLRLGTVGLFASDRDLDAVGHGHGRALAGVDVAGPTGPHVLAVDDFGADDLVPESVVEHGACALPGLLAGLEEHDHGARPQLAVLDEVLGQVEPDGDVGVMSAAVHDRGPLALGQHALGGGG